MSPVLLLFAAAMFGADAGAPAAQPATAPTAPRVAFDTTHGRFVLELDAAKAPKTVENFLAYAKAGFFDGTIFHRVIPDFMVQGGGFTADMAQKPTRDPVALEADNGLKNDRYTIAMARTSNPNSATSQFFINVKDNDMLNAPKPDGYGYTVFGRVVGGTDVVDKIRAVQTGNKGGMQNVPVETLTIKSATLAK